MWYIVLLSFDFSKSIIPWKNQGSNASSTIWHAYVTKNILSPRSLDMWIEILFLVACSILAQIVTCQTTVNVIAKWIFIFTIVLSDTGLQMWTGDNWWTVTHIRSRLQGLSWPWRTRHHLSGQAHFLTPQFSGQITMCLPPKQQAVREKQQPVIWWTHHLGLPMMTGSTPSLGWWLCGLSFLQSLGVPPVKHSSIIYKPSYLCCL
jgi:hypothetical protein